MGEGGGGGGGQRQGRRGPRRRVLRARNKPKPCGIQSGWEVALGGAGLRRNWGGQHGAGCRVLGRGRLVPGTPWGSRVHD